MSAPRIAPGDVITVDEPYYAYGLGTLHMRVTQVQDDGDPRWPMLHGVPIHPDGSEGQPRPARVDLEHVRVIRPGAVS